MLDQIQQNNIHYCQDYKICLDHVNALCGLCQFTALIHEKF